MGATYDFGVKDATSRRNLSNAFWVVPVMWLGDTAVDLLVTPLKMLLF